ncbi:MAG: DUF305 domain-containing protein [Rhodobacteraceae bacterium]|nr:DUF305 domain-containing protein [Paracoccaceae bacterium]
MTRSLSLAVPAALFALTLALPLAAQTTDHSGHDMTHGSAHSAMEDSPATTAFREANARMHAGMDIPFTGNADADFIRGMIAHHQGAIDMARIVLEHGSDPEVKTLATEIIAAQEAEIAWMQDWLAKNGG